MIILKKMSKQSFSASFWFLLLLVLLAYVGISKANNQAVVQTSTRNLLIEKTQEVNDINEAIRVINVLISSVSTYANDQSKESVDAYVATLQSQMDDLVVVKTNLELVVSSLSKQCSLFWGNMCDGTNATVITKDNFIIKDVQKLNNIITTIKASIQNYDQYLPWDGKASLPGPWSFWNEQVKALGQIQTRQWKDLTRYVISQSSNDTKQDVLTLIEEKLASLDVYLPWDGKASLPGPWSFWDEQIKALGKIYANLEA